MPFTKHLIKNIFILFIFMFLYLGKNFVYAENTTLNLSESVKMEVEPDRYKAILYYETKGKDTVNLQKNVNKNIKDAIKIAITDKNIKISTESYNVRSYYHNSVKDQFIASQKIILDSNDKISLLSIVSKIQQLGFLTKQLESYVSDKKKADNFDKLIKKAINLLELKASLIALSIGKKNIHFDKISVNHNFLYPRLSMIAARDSMMKAANASSDLPNLKSDNTSISINISVVITIS